MDKEIKNNSIVFDVREQRGAYTRGYTEMTAHMIVGVNLDAGFTGKAMFVADRHNVDTSPLMIYESVISRDSVWKVLNLQALRRNLQKKCDNLLVETDNF